MHSEAIRKRHSFSLLKDTQKNQFFLHICTTGNYHRWNCFRRLSGIDTAFDYVTNLFTLKQQYFQEGNVSSVLASENTSVWCSMLLYKFVSIIWCKECNFQEVKQICKWEIWHCKRSKIKKLCPPQEILEQVRRCLRRCTVMRSCRGRKEMLKRSEVWLIPIHD